MSINPTVVARTLAGLALAAIWCGCSVTPDKFTDVSTLAELPADPYEYRLAPGDAIHVEVLQDKDYTHETTVLPDGRASFIWVGELDVMDKTLAQTREMLRAKLTPYFTKPTLSLQLKRINGPDPIVFLGNFGDSEGGNLSQGHKGKSGVIPYRKGIGLMEALARAGGPGEPDIDVAPYLYVVRNMKSIKDRKVYRFDLSKAVRGDSPDLPLFPGDVMFLDQSWLQDLGRSFGYVTQVLAPVTGGLNTALLVDAIRD